MQSDFLKSKDKQQSETAQSNQPLPSTRSTITSNISELQIKKVTTNENPQQTACWVALRDAPSQYHTNKSLEPDTRCPQPHRSRVAEAGPESRLLSSTAPRTAGRSFAGGRVSAPRNQMPRACYKNNSVSG